MNWSQQAALVLEVIAVIVIAMSGVASVAVFVQVIRQRGWKRGEPSIVAARWQ